jgi:hypothetical protein
MKELIVIGVSEEGNNLVLKTNIKDQIELVGILEIIKMEVLSKAPSLGPESVNFPIPKTEA